MQTVCEIYCGYRAAAPPAKLCSQLLEPACGIIGDVMACDTDLQQSKSMALKPLVAVLRCLQPPVGMRDDAFVAAVRQALWESLWDGRSA